MNDADKLAFWFNGFSTLATLFSLYFLGRGLWFHDHHVITVSIATATVFVILWLMTISHTLGCVD